MTLFAKGVKNAELNIKVKGGHLVNIMKIKPIIIVNINCSQSIFCKNYWYKRTIGTIFMYLIYVPKIPRIYVPNYFYVPKKIN